MKMRGIALKNRTILPKYLSRVSAVLGDRARYLDRHFDDPGDDGRVEWMTVEIFHLQGPGMLSSHFLSQKLILKYTVIGHIGPNLMPFHFGHPVHRDPALDPVRRQPCFPPIRGEFNFE